MKIGWIGTGVMGVSMGGHLLAAGHALTVFNRTPSKAQPLLDKGAQWVDSPQAVAGQSAIVFTMVGFPADVRAVYLGKDGVLTAVDRAGRPGRQPEQRPANGQDARSTIFVDMTTTSPTLSQEIYRAAKAKGVAAIDAPVSGGDVGARNATLSIMVGGEKEAVAQVMPLFQLLGKTIVHQGGPGAGQHAKLANQIVIAGTIIGVCESLLYAAQAGLDLETMLRSIRPGAAACWTLENLAPRILKRNFDPGFYVEHFIKDLSIALEESRRMGLKLRGLELAHQLYERTRDLGHGKAGTQVLYLALEQMQIGKQKRRLNH